MDQKGHKPRRKRALHTLKGVLADGAYASLLAIPVAVGVAAYIFVYLSFLRRRLHHRAHDAAAAHGSVASDSDDQ
jgi:hypothetical protein